MLLNLNNYQLRESIEIGFKLKRDIQEIVEKNIELLLKLTYIKSDFVLGQLRFDSLAFDEANKAFVVLCFVRGNDFSIVDRAFSYLSVIYKNQAEFLLDYIYKTHDKIAKSEVNWDKCRVLFISQKFSFLQVESLNYRALPVELYQIKKYENDIIQFEKITNREETLEGYVEEKEYTVFQELEDEHGDFYENPSNSSSNLRSFFKESIEETTSFFASSEKSSNVFIDNQLELGNNKESSRDIAISNSVIPNNVENKENLIEDSQVKLPDDTLKLDWPFSNQFLKILEKD